MKISSVDMLHVCKMECYCPRFALFIVIVKKSLQSYSKILCYCIVNTNFSPLC